MNTARIRYLPHQELQVVLEKEYLF